MALPSAYWFAHAFTQSSLPCVQASRHWAKVRQSGDSLQALSSGWHWPCSASQMQPPCASPHSLVLPHDAPPAPPLPPLVSVGVVSPEHAAIEIQTAQSKNAARRSN